MHLKEGHCWPVCKIPFIWCFPCGPIEAHDCMFAEKELKNNLSDIYNPPEKSAY